LPSRPGELPRPSADYVAAVIALNAVTPEGVAEAASRFIDNFRLAAGPNSAFDEAAWATLGRAFAERPRRRDSRWGHHADISDFLRVWAQCVTPQN
jgi:hypothetical protein